MRVYDSLFYDPRRYAASIVLFIFSLTLLFIGLFGYNTTAMTIEASRDCDANAVIRCGARNFQELNDRFNQPGVATIYSAFGISADDITNISSRAVEGQVTTSNKVMVNGQVVATNAMTAGRQFMPGSTAMNINGMVFYRRPPSVSFASNSLPAFVVMNNGRFSYAIIASCGNPVIAQPVIMPPKTPATTNTNTSTTTQQPVRTPTPSPTVTNTNNNTNNNSNTNNNYVNVSLPASSSTETQPSTQTQSSVAPASTTGEAESLPSKPNYIPATITTSAPTYTPQSTQLPNTGPGNVLTLSGLTTLFAAIGHLAYRRYRTV